MKWLSKADPNDAIVNRVTPQTAPVSSEVRFCPAIRKAIPIPAVVYRRLEARMARVEGNATRLIKL